MGKYLISLQVLNRDCIRASQATWFGFDSGRLVWIGPLGPLCLGSFSPTSTPVVRSVHSTSKDKINNCGNVDWQVMVFMGLITEVIY